MKYFANKDFWKCYYGLPSNVQQLADNNFKLLKENPRHPSLHLKKTTRFWSVRIGLNYRAVGIESPHGIVWFWIGSHEEYNKLL